MLGDFIAKLGTEVILKATINNGSLHQDSNDYSVRIENFATSKNLVVKNIIFHVETFINTPGLFLMGGLKLV
jgi:hypothetical protein